ncbi:flowering-promoting factor 1-like protein 1 [Typha angustifolia]|uniref:flowering-promoting factor 1-like protein 1 n=1 Tax=Typha angustifolia TaxID=59011 RepID=UPI003C2D5D26
MHLIPKPSPTSSHYLSLSLSLLSLSLSLSLLESRMSGVWVFKNGVVRLVENPANEQASTIRRKALLHTPTNEVINSYASLESKLTRLGWERYYEDPDLLQFHKRSSVDLISLPKDFRQFKSMHMYDIVVKNRESFRVIDA